MAKGNDSGFKLYGQPVMLVSDNNSMRSMCFGIFIGEYKKQNNGRFHAQKYQMHGDTTCALNLIHFDDDKAAIDYICNPPKNAWVLDELKATLEDAGIL